MNGFRADAALRQLLAQTIGGVLGAGKHQRAMHILVIQQVLQQLALIAFFNEEGQSGQSSLQWWILAQLRLEVDHIRMLLASS